MEQSAILRVLQKSVQNLGARALEDLLTADKPLDMMGTALKHVQDGRRVMDDQVFRLVGALGLATQSDLGRVSRKISRLRKRMVALVAGLDGTAPAQVEHQD